MKLLYSYSMEQHSLVSSIEHLQGFVPSPSFPGQKRLDLAPGKIYSSHNGMEVHLASSGIFLDVKHSKQSFKEMLKYWLQHPPQLQLSHFVYIQARIVKEACKICTRCRYGMEKTFTEIGFGSAA